MKKLILPALLLGILLFSCSKDSIEGTYRTENESELFRTQTTFSSDGSFTSIVDMMIGDEEKRFLSHGTYSVEDDILIIGIQRSASYVNRELVTDQELNPPQITKHRIVYKSDTELHTAAVTEEGEKDVIKYLKQP